MHHWTVWMSVTVIQSGSRAQQLSGVLGEGALGNAPLASHTLIFNDKSTGTVHWCLVRGWLRGTVVERRSLAGELSLSCARPAADG